MERRHSIQRHTTETRISLTFGLDGDGSSSIQTGLPFLDHMLTLFTKHGYFNLDVTVDGDIEVDGHHTTEDLAICLGQAFREALGDGAGIHRYASGSIPMDEALCQVAIDISNRPSLTFNADFPKTKVGDFDVELVEEFFHGFVNNARIALHIDLIRGNNLHHMIEAIYKAFGVVLSRAVEKHPDRSDIPSTKGVL